MKEKDSSKGSTKTAAIKKVQSPAILKHAVQLEKLQHKAALETSVTESIRNFLKQKASLEKECAVAVQKLINQHSTRKDFVAYLDILHGNASPKRASDPTVPDKNGIDTSEEHDDSLTLAQWWKDCLNELQKLQTLRIGVCDDVLKVTTEELKLPKAARQQQVKQALDIAIAVQGEINQVVDMSAQAKRSYTESETIVQDMRQKVKKVEEKAKKKHKPIQIPEKITETLRNETPKATAARNEYILSLVGANSQLSRYYSHDLPYIIDMMNGNLYETTRQVLSSVITAEQRVIPESQELFYRLGAELEYLSNRKDIESLLGAHTIFRDAVQYAFESLPCDTSSSIALDGDAGISMDKCARKWAIRLLENEIAQKKLVEQMESLVAQESGITTVEGKSAFESKMFSTKESLRRASNFQHKAEALLDVLKKAGVDVDRWLESAKAAVEQKITASSSGPEIISTLPLNPPRSRRSSAAPSATPNEVATLEAADDASDEQFSTSRCIVLYDYAADRQDELSVTANEELTVINASTDEEWLLVENSSGQQGYVPKNYVEIAGLSDAQNNGILNYYPPATPAEEGYGQSWETADSASYPSWSDPTPAPPSWENESTDWVAEDTATAYTTQHSSHAPSEADRSSLNGRSRTFSSSSQKSQSENDNGQYFDSQGGQYDKNSSPAVGYCRAICDFHTEDPEDLSFNEGDVIKVLSHSHGDVDDGYWMGEIHGRVGLFMSGLTEEMTEMDATSDIGTSLSSMSMSPAPVYEGVPDHFGGPSVPVRLPNCGLNLVK